MCTKIIIKIIQMTYVKENTIEVPFQDWVIVQDSRFEECLAFIEIYRCVLGCVCRGLDHSQLPTYTPIHVNNIYFILPTNLTF